MTRLSLCVIALALAAGHSMALPTTVEHAVHDFEMGTYQETETPGNSDTTTTTTTTTTTPTQDGPEQWLDNFLKAVQRQLQLQETLLRQIMKDIQEYLGQAFNWGNDQSSSFARVNEMMDAIATRMHTNTESTTELLMNTQAMEPEMRRRAANKYMREVRVQDVLIDALWASLRGVQTSAWMNGLSSTEPKELDAMGSRAAEEFLSRMYNNVRASGVSEEEIETFMPASQYLQRSEHRRNMGRRGYGYGYYGYGYSYPYYSHAWRYPYYSYGWGYPSYYYGHPHHYWRRLRAGATPVPCPDCPPGATPLGEMPTPPFSPMRGLGEGMTGYNTPMGYGMPPEFTTVPHNIGLPMQTMAHPTPVGPMETPYEPVMPMAGLRSLAPVVDTPGFFPEPPMNVMPFGPGLGAGFGI